MSKTDLWMPLYIGDYLADTMHLTAVQHGAYLLLIMHYWRTGPLPDDDRALAAIARMERREWASAGAAIKGFFQNTAGLLHHKRIDAERARAGKTSLARRVAANSRWESRARGAKAGAIASANAEAMQVDSSCPAYDSHNHSEKEPPLSPQQARRLHLDGVVPDPESGEPTVNGWYLNPVAEKVLAIAQIDPVRWRGDYQPIVRWLMASIEPERIYAAVERAAGRAGYRPPFSLAWFDARVTGPRRMAQ